MANHKSAIKRIRQTIKRTERNRKQRSATRTAVKAVREAVTKGDKKEALQALSIAAPLLMKAGQSHLYHPGKASRRISRLTLSVNGLK